MPPLSLSELELKLIEILRSQALPAEEIRLIGLLSKGNKAAVFSVVIDGVYHVLKAYDTAALMRAELKNLRKMTPKDRFLFSWQEELEDSTLNLVIIQVPEGQELNSELLTSRVSGYLANRLIELYRIRYRQRISLSSLRERLERSREPFLEAIKQLGYQPEPYAQLLLDLESLLDHYPDIFRTHKVRVHGDLWWPNIIVAEEDVYLIDWESLHRGDPAEDIAKLRLITYWPRSDLAPDFFWRSPDHRDRISEATGKMAERYNRAVGNENLNLRLRFYLPLLCVYELGLRYLMTQPDLPLTRVQDEILAAEALTLFSNPFAAPPDLERNGFFGLINQAPAEVGVNETA